MRNWGLASNEVSACEKMFRNNSECCSLERSKQVAEPKCTKNDIITRYNLQKAARTCRSQLKGAQTNIDFINKELENTRGEIQAIINSLYELDTIGGNCLGENYLGENYIGENQVKANASDLSKVKESLRADLATLRRQECILKKELQEARITLRNTRLDELMISEEIRGLKDKEKCWDDYNRSKAIAAEERLQREEQSKQNAEYVRQVTIGSVANSITTHVLMDKLPGDLDAEPLMGRAMKEDVHKYVEDSFNRARLDDVVTLTNLQLRQKRQVVNLLKLKGDLKKIRKSVAMTSNIKRLQEEEIEKERQSVRASLAAQGANPYLAEYILQIEERHRAIQRKMLMNEQKRLLDMQREYSKIEASKAKEEADRKRWDEHWDQLAKEKAQQEKRLEFEMFFEISDEESEHKEDKRMSGFSKTESRRKIGGSASTVPLTRRTTTDTFLTTTSTAFAKSERRSTNKAQKSVTPTFIEE